MILGERVKDLVVVGEDTSKKAKISQDKLAKLQYLLTKGLYKDPITAVIAEWTNNGIDAVVQAGKSPIENPVIVSILKDAKGQYYFRVEDRGTGLDDRDFEDICMNYLESTKEEDNETIGHFGIGMKSFLSLERSATFTCRKNGIERKYLVYEGAEFVNFDLIYQKDTEEENGVTAELVISSYNERKLFIDKASAKLAYYDTAVLVVDGGVEENNIFRTDLFQWSTLNTNQNMHLCLKDVYYPIDWEALEIKNPIQLPIALRLTLANGVRPTPSRESYISNERTKELIMSKIRDTADWFVDKYNNTVKNFKNFMDAYEYLGHMNFYVNLEDEGTEFKINTIAPYSQYKISPPKVNGITLRNPNDYKVKKHELLASYSPVGYTNYLGILKTKVSRIGVSRERHVFEDRGVTVLVGDNFRGNIKSYLKEKYGPKTLFLKHNGFKRSLGKYLNMGSNILSESYRYLLELNRKKKGEWRSHIKEWDLVVSSIVSTFKDETKVETDKDFHDWITKKRDTQRELRKLKGGTGYNGLGKQLGDVTLAYSYRRYNKVHFNKKPYPINELSKNDFLTVLLTDDDNIELAKEIISSIGKQNVRFAHVGKIEIKKIPNHFQFINFKKFMSRDCKPFMRLASAIKFQRVLQDYNNITNYKNIVFRKILSVFNNDAILLSQYVSNNMTHNLRNDLEDIIIDIADQHNLYDQSLWAEFKRLEEGVRKYDFINLMNVPSSTNHTLTKRYETLVNQLLLFRKKFYNDLPEGTKIVFEEVKKEENELV